MQSFQDVKEIQTETITRTLLKSKGSRRPYFW